MALSLHRRRQAQPQALDACADPAVVAGWIAETHAERQRYLQQLSAKPVECPQPEPLSVQQIEQLLAGLGDLVGVLRDADPEHKLGVYKKARLGNTFRWELEELGYSKKFVETATEGLVVYLTRKS